MNPPDEENGDTWTKLRKLARPRKGRVVGGVCAAFGQATPIPAWMWRALFCVAVLLYGTGIVLYLILMLCIPSEPGKSA